jgi:hypothetical protein
MKQTRTLFAGRRSTHLGTGTPNIGTLAEVVAEGRVFASMEEEWEGLRAASPAATPFQSWAWLFSWWENYGEGRLGLRLLTCRGSDGALLGALPLVLERGPCPLPGRLLFLGSGTTDHLDMLAREGSEGRVAAAFLPVLRSMGGWSVADLQQVGPGAAAWGLYRAWAGPKASAWQDGCPVLDFQGRGWEARLELLNQKHRSNVRRTLRRAEYDGTGWEMVPPERAAEAARRLVRLHREAWEGRSIGPEHLTDRFEAHLTSAAGRMTRAGVGAVSELRRNGEVVASHLLAIGPDAVEEYLTGANAEVLRCYSVDALCVHDAAEVARRHGFQKVSAGRGEEAYKMRWRPRVEHNRRLLLGRSAAAFWPYAAWRLGYAKARRWANSGAAPEWVARAADRYRTLRFWLARRKVSAPVDRTPEHAADRLRGGTGHSDDDRG